MLQVQGLYKSYGIATVLSDISFVINDGEHVGLIGANGAGKSTLLQCIVGLEQPDAGAIVRAPPDLAIGYLPQAQSAMADRTIDQVIAAAQAAWSAAGVELQHAADALANAADMEAALAHYDEALARFEALGGYEREHRAAAVLEGLGLGAVDRATPVAALSGGQKTRLGLAALLLSEPDLLLLDEPTNHLDVEALEWLEGFVRSYPHAALIVSHDREFLDRTVTRILSLDIETRSVTSYAGNYSAFAAAREHERELKAESYKKQQEYIRSVRADILRLKAQALNTELASTPDDPDAKFALSGKGGAKKVARKARARERKLERYLESDERVEKPRQRWSLKLDFGDPPPGGRSVVSLEGVSFTYAAQNGRGAAARLLLQDVQLEVQHGERIALVGPNGAGKTTLLRLIAGSLQPLCGRVRIGGGVRIGVLTQEHEALDLRRSVLDTVRYERPMSETEARNFLHFFLFGGESVFRRVGECSLGERSRLQLALLVLRGCNLLLLDEPLNHLDIEGREHFEAALDAFEGTVIAVAHDRAFLRHFAQRIVEVRAGQVRSFVGTFDDFVRAGAAREEAQAAP